MRKLSLNDEFYWLIVCMQSRFSLQKSGKMSMWQDGLLFADDLLYVKLMTEKSEKKMLCCKICYYVLCIENSCFLNNAYLYIMS